MCCEYVGYGLLVLGYAGFVLVAAAFLGLAWCVLPCNFMWTIGFVFGVVLNVVVGLLDFGCFGCFGFPVVVVVWVWLPGFG